MHVLLFVCVSLFPLVSSPAFGEETSSKASSAKDAATKDAQAKEAASNQATKEATGEGPRETIVEKDGTFRSIAPLAGYNPTYGAFIGLGYFSKTIVDQKLALNWALMGIVAQKKGATQLIWRGEKRLSNLWGIEWRNEFANGFEANYGAGNETRVEDRIDVPLTKDEIDLHFRYHIWERFTVGPVIRVRARHNRPMPDRDFVRQVNPIEDRELTGSFGVLQRFDFRDNTSDPSRGWVEEFEVKYTKPFQGRVEKSFTSVELQISNFQSLLSQDLILATSLSGGITSGTPTFLHEFRLGGTHKLRGYYQNRFRGSRYYVQQSELRFPLIGAVSGTTFLEFGEATYDQFRRPHVSYGGGLLFGLPPDKVSKIRFDFALSPDQQGFLVDFGHAF